MARTEIRLSGAGGQGMIMAGIILAEATLEEKGLNVVQTQSYGPESRGGASRAEVILSNQLIAYPKVIEPDILVALTQEAFDRYSLDVKDEGIIIIDGGINIVSLIKRIKTRILSFPILKTAEDKIGMILSANIIVLGIITNFIQEIRPVSLKKAVAKRVPAETLAINLKAFKLGEDLSRGLKKRGDYFGY